jgi:hypothetical protein
MQIYKWLQGMSRMFLHKRIELLKRAGCMSVSIGESLARPCYNKTHPTLSFGESYSYNQLTLLKLVVFLLVPRYNSYIRSALVSF